MGGYDRRRAWRGSPGRAPRSASFGEQLLDALVPRPKLGILEMELAVPRVANHAPLVDQNEARPIADAVGVPGTAVVVLRIGIGDVLPAEGPGEVALVVLTGVGWELRRMNTDYREPTLPIQPIVRHERRHGARAIAAGEHPEVEQHHAAAQLGQPQRLVAVEPARVGEFGRRGPANARTR